MTADAGYDALARLLPRVTYRPGWTLHLDWAYDGPADRDGTLALVVTTGSDILEGDEATGRYVYRGTIDPTTSRDFPVVHAFRVPESCSDWPRWVLDRLIDVETHETREFFRVDGHTSYHPHGPNVDPYAF